MFIRRSRLRTLFLCMVLEFGLLAGLPMRPEEVARLVRWLAGPRAEQADPDDAAKGDGGYSRDVPPGMARRPRLGEENE